jgi:hypothetical protein
VRSFDDSLVVKGLDHGHKVPDHDGSVRNIVWRNCVVWNDWGRGLEVGAETQAPLMESLVFENIDVVHYVHRALDIQHGDRAMVRNVLFKDIRVEDPITEGAAIAEKPHTPDEVGLLAELIIYFCMWNKDEERGQMEAVRFEDVRVLSEKLQRVNISGYDANHVIKDVVFQNLIVKGKQVERLEPGMFTINEFAKGISIC